MLLEDCKALTQNCHNGEIWVRDLAAGLSYATENRGWLLNIYQSMEHPQLERILCKMIRPLMQASFEEALAGRPVNEEDRRFVLDIFTYGVTACF